MTPDRFLAPFTRRDLLRDLGAGFGTLGLAGVLAGDALLSSVARASGANTDPLAPRFGHFPARAKRVIYLFMNGGPSHVDTFDPKPMLAKHNGQEPPKGMTRAGKTSKLMQSPLKFQKFG